MSNPPIAPVLKALHPDYADVDFEDWGSWRAIRCAFHGDRHASASYHPEENVFVCHQCGLKGDAFEIVKEVEGVDFPTAKQRVADITGHSGESLSADSGLGGRGGRSRLPQRKGTSAQRRARLSDRARRR